MKSLKEIWKGIKNKEFLQSNNLGGSSIIFLDSGYFRALNDEKDSHHSESLKIKNYLNDSNQKTVINTTVLVETLNRAEGAYDVVEKMYHDLHAQNQVIKLTNEDYLKSLELSKWFGNSINYGDCTILTTMMNMGIDTIVSFDEDFKKIDVLNVIFAM